MPGPAKKSTLKRPIHKMPAYVSKALREHQLMEAYRARPPYQQNDYVGWISRAKREPTRMKRLHQMIEELQGGKLYMNMTYRPRS